MNSQTDPRRLLLFLSLAACLGLQGYDLPLNPRAIHDAYVLGARNDHTTGRFLEPYTTQCSAPPQSCFTTQIEILTPFAQVVELSRQNAPRGYTEQQAAADMRRRGQIVIVRITLMLPAAYAAALPNQPQETSPPDAAHSAALRPENLWHNFRFTLKQRERVIDARSAKCDPIYSTATKEAPPVLDGATVSLEFDAKLVASDQTTIEVVTADHKTFSASFDLRKLR